MSDRVVIRCREPAQAHRALTTEIWPLLKAHLLAGRRMSVELRQESRSPAENRLLHALLQQISREVEWAGKRRNVETWKRLLVAAWCRARGEHVELLPALDGHGVDVVFRHTSHLTRAECAELSDYVLAWGTERGVDWRPASLGAEMAGALEDAP